jgi:predicted dehydrogenase
VVAVGRRHDEASVVQALEAGLDVLVEKPLADSLESAERIAAVAAESEGFCMVGFHNRFLSPIEVLTAYRDDGLFGGIDHIEANYIRRRGIPGRGSWFTRAESAGGGAVIDVGPHVVDLAFAIADFPQVTEVSAKTRSTFGTREDYAYLGMWGEDKGADAFDVEDSASAFVRCDDGTTMAVEIAWATNREPTTECFVRGTDAGAHFDFHNHDLEVYETSNRGASHHRTMAIETDGPEPHAAQDKYFLECVAAREPPTRNTVEQALEVQRVLDGIYRSSEEGRSISFD